MAAKESGLVLTRPEHTSRAHRHQLVCGHGCGVNATTGSPIVLSRHAVCLTNSGPACRRQLVEALFIVRATAGDFRSNSERGNGESWSGQHRGGNGQPGHRWMPAGKMYGNDTMRALFQQMPAAEVENYNNMCAALYSCRRDPKGARRRLFICPPVFLTDNPHRMNVQHRRN